MESGIQSLPVEILENIFHECVPPDHITDMHTKLACLSQVCRRWNHTLLSQPSFWSYIRIGPRRHSLTTLVIPFVELWLQRSGTTYPLSVMLYIYFDKVMAPNIIDLIIPHAHRWKNIHFELGSRDPYNALCNLPHGSTPMLESAALLTPFWPQEVMVRVWNTIGSSPLLFSVELNDIFSKELVSVRLPWHQLTSLEIPSNTECDYLLEIILRCTSLTRLIIAYPVDSEGLQSPNSSPITIPYLRYLGLYISESSSFIPPTLVAPLLDTFYIHIADGVTHEQYLSFDGFLGRSGCKLRSLIVVNSEPQSQFLIPLLKSANLMHLEELEIRKVDDQVLQAMAITDDLGSSSSQIIRSALRRLDLEIECEMVREGLLSSMLLGWVKAGSGLNDARFGVHKQDHGFIDDLEVVEEVRELGIHVVIDAR